MRSRNVVLRLQLPDGRPSFDMPILELRCMLSPTLPHRVFECDHTFCGALSSSRCDAHQLWKGSGQSGPIRRRLLQLVRVTLGCRTAFDQRGAIALADNEYIDGWCADCAHRPHWTVLDRGRRRGRWVAAGIGRRAKQGVRRRTWRSRVWSVQSGCGRDAACGCGPARCRFAPV